LRCSIRVKTKTPATTKAPTTVARVENGDGFGLSTYDFGMGISAVRPTPLLTVPTIR
jgi:hypothetical protein